MIDDSTPWRSDLLRFATSIQRGRKRVLREDQAFFRLERDHMYGFFAVRRLIESFKLSTTTANLAIPVTQYPFRTKSFLTMHNRADIARHYDFDRPTKAALTLRALCNQVIHSYVFTLAIDQASHLVGLFVNSEYRRRRTLAYVPAWRTARIFRRIAKDWPSAYVASYDPARNDYAVLAWMGGPTVPVGLRPRVRKTSG